MPLLLAFLGGMLVQKVGFENTIKHIENGFKQAENGFNSVVNTLTTKSDENAQNTDFNT